MDDLHSCIIVSLITFIFHISNKTYDDDLELIEFHVQQGLIFGSENSEKYFEDLFPYLRGNSYKNKVVAKIREIEMAKAGRSSVPLHQNL